MDNSKTLSNIDPLDEFLDIPNFKRIIIIGGIGVGNIGDEAILTGIIKKLKQKYKGIQITVPSYDYEETIYIHKVNSIPRISLRMFIELIKTDVILIGGGTIYFKGMSYVAQITPFIVLFGRILGKKFLYYGIGISSSTPILAKLGLLSTIPLAISVNVRDTFSIETLRLWGVKRRINLVPDPAFEINPIKIEPARKRLHMEGVDLTKILVGLSLRYLSDKEINKHLIIESCKIIDWLIENYNVEIIFFPFSRHKYTWFEQDDHLAMEIKQLINNKNNFKILRNKYTPEEISGMIGIMDIFIGMRLHSMILSNLMNVPLVGISYEDKCSYFLNIMGVNEIKVKEITFEKLKYEIERIL